MPQPASYCSVRPHPTACLAQQCIQGKDGAAHSLGRKMHPFKCLRSSPGHSLPYPPPQCFPLHLTKKKPHSAPPPPPPISGESWFPAALGVMDLGAQGPERARGEVGEGNSSSGELGWTFGRREERAEKGMRAGKGEAREMARDSECLPTLCTLHQ